MGVIFLKVESDWQGVGGVGGSKMIKNWLTSIANAPLRDMRKKDSHQILGKDSGKKYSFSLESPLWRCFAVSAWDMLFQLSWSLLKWVPEG